MKFRLFIKLLMVPLPSVMKRVLYRSLFRYKIGRRVRIGLSIIDANECVIEDDVSIGHFNVFIGTKKLSMGDHVRIGHLNIFRGGNEIRMGRYAEVVRLNEINSIKDPDVMNEYDPTFILGEGSVVVTSHKIDFTDRVEIGRCSMVGGRSSSLWTHNRQITKPIIVGDHVYLGSEIRIVPGGDVPSGCIVGIGSVVTKRLEGESMLIAGVPAKPVKSLDEEGQFLTRYKTRRDLPDNF